MTERASLELHNLPAEVAELLQRLDVHPYLLAHLVLVHDSAQRLVSAIQENWPALSLDAELVHFGAATHDIGKVQHPEEMSGPGSKHHRAGSELLQGMGVEAHRARFAQTHGAWRNGEGSPIEDLLVSLADVIWSGGREQDLEDMVTERLAESDGSELWQAFMALDDILTQITKDAELRLVWQTQFAPERGDSQEI